MSAKSYYKHHVFFCTNRRDPPEKCCADAGAVEVQAYAKSRIKELGLNGKGSVRVNKAGCFSQCGHGPMIVVYPENVWYGGVKESDLPEILESHLLGGVPVKRLLYEPGVPGANKVKGT